MFSSHASPYAAKTLKIILTHRVYPHCSMSSCHHTEQSGDNNIKCGDRTRGGGAAYSGDTGQQFITHNVLDWRLLEIVVTEEELHRRRTRRRSSRPGADELRRISCDRIYQLWSRSGRLRHLSLHRAIRAAGVDCVQLCARY